jgi:glc operon protein GlcG
MSNTTAEINVEAPITSNPLDVIPDEIPFDVPYGALISLEQAQAAIKPLWPKPNACLHSDCGT